MIGHTIQADIHTEFNKDENVRVFETYDRDRPQGGGGKGSGENDNDNSNSEQNDKDNDNGGENEPNYDDLPLPGAS